LQIRYKLKNVKTCSSFLLASWLKKGLKKFTQTKGMIFINSTPSNEAVTFCMMKGEAIMTIKA
ncbi:hypothetical protein, partial [Klebsiella pneumoniae]|uniref:hypothetical protein n=1 Tax=Klebsiella pneumoniae TaxID=573 RepID=UPI001C3DA8C6